MDLCHYMTERLIQVYGQEESAAEVTATHYMEMLTRAGFDNYTALREMPGTLLYGHLLGGLHSLAYEQVPKALVNHLETHLINTARLTLDYFTLSETVPVGGNTVNQLPARCYILVAVAVDTVLLEDRSVVWQISLHIPDLPDQEDPDYECLMLPHALWERGAAVLADQGFTYERGLYFHQGPEFGRRRVDSEAEGLEKLTNYLNEIRGGLHGAGPNNGLVLILETGEDLALVQQLLTLHGHNLFLDVVKGVTCLDHYRQVTQQAASYSGPTFQYRVGQGGCWTARVAGCPLRAETKPECIYLICQNLLGASPDFNNFIRWYSYPLNHSQTSRLLSTLEHIHELLPLQHYIEQHLCEPVVLKGIYAPRSPAEATWSHHTCARQTIRRLVSLGFTLEVLTKIFRFDPQHEIPRCVFLQNMSEVHQLQVHSQTDQLRHLIKQFFVSQL